MKLLRLYIHVPIYERFHLHALDTYGFGMIINSKIYLHIAVRVVAALFNGGCL